MRYSMNLNLNAGLGVIVLIALILIAGLWQPLPANFRWLLIMAIITLFLMGVGKGVGGRYDSILIDSRYKISLSRFQLTLWTVLVLSAFLTMALDRNIPALTARFVDGLDPLNIRFPEELLVALGISTASLAGSSLIKRTKTETESSQKIELLEEDIRKATSAHEKAREAFEAATRRVEELNREVGNLRGTVNERQAEVEALRSATPDQIERAQVKLEQAKAELERKTQDFERAQRELQAAEDAVKRAEKELEIQRQARENKKGIIHQNESPAEAEWSDLFRGDEIVNYRVIDIAKVQMFFFTIAIVFTYGVLIWSLLLDAEKLRVPILDFPPFSASLNGLLALSHAGYLAVKGTS